MKIYYYIIVMIGVILLLQMAGVETSMDGVFSFVKVSFNENNTVNSTEIDVSDFSNTLFGLDGVLATLLAGAGAFGVAYLAGVRGPTLILTPFVMITVAQFGITMTGIINHAISLGNTWVSGIIGLILIPFSVGFVFAAIDMWRGTG